MTNDQLRSLYVRAGGRKRTENVGWPHEDCKRDADRNRFGRIIAGDSILTPKVPVFEYKENYYLRISFLTFRIMSINEKKIDLKKTVLHKKLFNNYFYPPVSEVLRTISDEYFYFFFICYFNTKKFYTLPMIAYQCTKL